MSCNLRCKKLSFNRKINNLIVENLCYIFILKRQDLLLLSLHIVRLNELGIHLSPVSSIVIFLHIFDNGVTSNSLFNEIF